jgi:hypothetical protein
MWFFKKRTKNDYEKEFLEALNFSRKMLNDNIPFKFNRKKVLSDNASSEISNKILEEYGQFDFNKAFSGQCTTANCLMFEFLKNFCKCDIHYTIGYLTDKINKYENGEKIVIFKENREQIIKYVKNDTVRIGNPEKRKINLHAWVTLSSMEIIDITLSATLSSANVPYFSAKEKPYRIIAGYPCSEDNYFEYHPQVIIPSDKILEDANELISTSIIL